MTVAERDPKGRQRIEASVVVVVVVVEIEGSSPLLQRATEFRGAGWFCSPLGRSWSQERLRAKVEGVKMTVTLTVRDYKSTLASGGVEKSGVQVLAAPQAKRTQGTRLTICTAR